MGSDFMLSPLRFSHQRLDALAVGARLVAPRGDHSLAGDARLASNDDGDGWGFRQPPANTLGVNAIFDS